ncbi:fibronectin type III domain-containing protein [Knoellia sp. CPCC 206435]|uniref:fibronectin type III domain-containing protein n=1 Tax=Knoellia terrae TaxID=3404797 RepID=UPI003B42A70C
MGAHRLGKDEARTRDVAPSAEGGPPRRHWPRERPRATIAGVVALGLTAATLSAVPAIAINSNPPTGPGNIEIFPMRDMVAIEGYTEQAGRTATITATRGGAVIGKTTGTVGADGFLEANHPGGVCWGVGTGAPQVTPDLQAGDEIRVDFADGSWDGSKVVDIEATGVVLDEANHRLTINGRYGPGVDMPGTDLVADPGKVGIEIVNPDMRNGSAIGERAIGWPGHAPDPLDPEPPGGYTVDGTVTGSDAAGGTFAVTYGFQNAADLELANAGSITALGWLAEPDPALGLEAQLGLTLNEFYEFGGPGMGGCPAGPQLTRTSGPEVYSALGAGAGSITVNWDDVAATPGTPAVTGYTVRAVSADGVDEVGKRLPNTTATKETTTLSGLVAGDIYSIEVASKSAAGEGTPSVISRVRAAEHIVPTATATTLRRPNADGKYAPLLTNVNGDFGVHLDPVPGLTPTAEIHYTTDGSTPTITSPTFVPGVSSSIQIRQDTTLRWIVKDSGNIVGPQSEKLFDIIESSNPAPVISKVAATPVSGAVDVTWNKLAADGENPVNAYRVQVYTGSSVDVATGVRVGDPVNVAQPADATATEVVRRMVGLTNGTAYKFSVAARYGTVFSDESALSEAVAPEAAAAANAGPDQTVLRGRIVTLDGNGSTKASTYQWTQIRPKVTNANGTTYQDPLLTITGATSAKPTFRFPVKSSVRSDDDSFQFRLTTTHLNADGTTFNRSDLVDVSQRPDAVAATRTRWRAGDNLTGTGSQEGARLAFHSGSHTGPQVAVAIVTNGAWSLPGTNAQPTGGKFYVWSDHGYVGEITVTP